MTMRVTRLATCAIEETRPLPLATGSVPLRPDLAVVMAEIGAGGMGKMRIHLVNELVARGYRVDLVLGKRQSAYSIPIDERVRVIHIGTSHTVFGAPRLACYLRANRPRVMLTQRHRVNVLAWRARRMARVATRLFASSETHESNALAELPAAKRSSRLHQIKHYVARNDGIIAISQGVAEDFAGLTGRPLESIDIVPNPIIEYDVDARAAEAVDHPWFNEPSRPVIVSAGRLSTAKNFPMLLRAFAAARDELDARLVIFGAGPEQDKLRQLARELGIESFFDLPGFVDNLYAYFARSSLFVLSSRLEGLSNVLVEAMAVGTPIVATDCPTGPAEVLEGGRLGTLVPVDDVDSMSAAIRSTLASPPDPSALRETARKRYSVEHSTSQYVRVLGLDQSAETASSGVPGA